jgi:hypothetical protein
MKKEVLILILFFIWGGVVSVMGEEFSSNSDPNEIDTEIYHCFFDPDLEELMVHANTIKEPLVSNEILFKILEIRPNCMDVYQSISFNYAKLNDMKNFRKADFRFRKLQTEYNMMTGNFSKSPQFRMSESKGSSKELILQKPSPQDKIRYWRWYYIHSKENH